MAICPSGMKQKLTPLSPLILSPWPGIAPRPVQFILLCLCILPRQTALAPLLNSSSSVLLIKITHAERNSTVEKRNFTSPSAVGQIRDRDTPKVRNKPERTVLYSCGLPIGIPCDCRNSDRHAEGLLNRAKPNVEIMVYRVCLTPAGG